MIRVKIQEEVLEYLRSLPPQPRNALKVAIKGLSKERGNIKSLTDDLEGFHRLRVGSHRVIFDYNRIDGEQVITCVYAGPRKWIYEVFHSKLREAES
jgi:mRNA-degrading endonuclease RelE of RelBE toxin-antitoxin system